MTLEGVVDASRTPGYEATDRSAIMSPSTAAAAPRDKILDAAEQLFARRGYAGVGLSEIAVAVGLGKSSLFHHFRSKAQLYAAVVKRILMDIESDLDRVVSVPGTAMERLDRWVDALVEILGEHRSYSRLLLRSLFENEEFSGVLEEEREVNEILARILGGVRDVLREGQDRGEFRHVSIPHTVQSLIGLVVYHFASDGLEDRLFPQSVFEPEEVSRRKEEIKALLHQGLLAAAKS